METLHSETRTVHGIVYKVSVVASDEQPDLSWLGEFTDLTADAHGCGKRHVRNSYDSREYKYFCPAFGCDPRPWKEIAAENDWTKDQMFKAAQEDMTLAREWYDCYIMVEADLGFAGEAYASLGGLDWNNDEDFIEGEALTEVIAEAEYEVEQKLYHAILGGNPRLAVTS